MIDFSHFYNQLSTCRLHKYRGYFEREITSEFNRDRHGDLSIWLQALENLPNIPVDEFTLEDCIEINSQTKLSPSESNQLEQCFRALIPWRKGPFRVFDLYIDTEWRSDLKWQRLLPHIDDLNGKSVLDVGCGSGYHCWRMVNEGASWVLGIDPSPRFVIQFEMIKHYIGGHAIDVIPLGIEKLPKPLDFFDTCFSMGVLYHRTSPIDHLKELKASLKVGGELILETLIIDGERGQSLVPEARYASMKNVWFLPTIDTLIAWMKKCGFINVRCVDINQTSIEEQRTTEWMPSHSLSDFLDPIDKNTTIEGHPAPKRAIFIANRGGKINV